MEILTLNFRCNLYKLLRKRTNLNHKINQTYYSITSILKIDSVKLVILVTLVYSKLMQVLFIQIVKYYFRCIPLTDRSPKAIKDRANLLIENKNMKLGIERERERDKLEAQRIKLEGINQYLAPLSLVSFSSLFLMNWRHSKKQEIYSRICAGNFSRKQRQKVKKLCEVAAKRKIKNK